MSSPLTIRSGLTPTMMDMGTIPMRSLATQQNGLIVMEMEWVTIMTNFLKMVVNG